MLQVRKSLLVFSVLVLAACNAMAQTTQATQIPDSTNAQVAVVNTPVMATATISPTATETITPLTSETATQAAAIPLFLTSTPGIAATLTAVYSTPEPRKLLKPSKLWNLPLWGQRCRGFPLHYFLNAPILLIPRSEIGWISLS